MIELTNVDVKQKLSKEMKELVAELNSKITEANKLRLRVWVSQNPSFNGLANSVVNISIDETVSY